MFTVEETKELEPSVREAYSADPVLIDLWHITAGAGLDACVKRTVDDLLVSSSLRFYRVTEDGEFVGYFGTEFDGKYSPTIFIAPKFRDRKAEFWAEMEKRTEAAWRSACFVKNTPCMKFYAKKGREMAKIESPDGTVAVFKFERAGT